MIPRGYLYVIGCACSFGFITTLAKLTYEEGASPTTVVFFRLLAGSLLMGILSAWSHRKNLFSRNIKPKLSSPWKIKILIVVTGISIAVMSLGYLGSVKFIPVSLSVLLFFTFPFWILLINFISSLNRSIIPSFFIPNLSYSMILLILGLNESISTHSLFNA